MIFELTIRINPRLIVMVILALHLVWKLALGRIGSPLVLFIVCRVKCFCCIPKTQDYRLGSFMFDFSERIEKIFFKPLTE
ncbi:Uncharacterised protein [Legionella pneumophila]|nr:Uncharacterised protein [Legionella pneumophila]CZH47452.1 Uncharacterised protein [Legionella pneumophila]